MTILSDFREKYPQYNDMSDIDLAKAMHKKFYSDMPEHEFAVKIGLVTQDQADKVLANMGGHVGAPSVGPSGASGKIQEALTSSPVANDVVQSAATGIRSGLESTVGAFGDVADLNARGAGWVADKLGASPETTGMVEKGVRAVSGGVPLAPTTSDVQAVTNPVMGEHYQPQTTAGEYARTAGEFLPAAALGEGNLARRVATQAIIPALGSETAGQMTKGTAYEAPARVLGAMAGPGALALGSRALTPLPASAGRIAAADTLAAEGVDITAGQRTGSDKLRYMEGELGGNAAGRFNERQGEQFTRATLRRAGIQADRATPEVMDQAFDRIGQQFDDVAARNTLVPDRQFATDLSATLREYNSLVPASQRAPVVMDIATDIVQGAVGTGQMEGARYQALRSRLDRLSRGAAADPHLSTALRDIRNTLDDAMERSIAANNPPDAGAWRHARREYRNILVIERAASGAGAQAASGIITPAALRNATVQVQRRRNYVRGQGDFAGLAHAGNEIMAPLPNSGTASRMAARGVGATMGMALGGTLPGVGHIAGAVAGAVAPGVLGRAILSRPGRAILGNQRFQGRPVADVGRDAFIAGLVGNYLGAKRETNVSGVRHDIP